MIDCRRSSR